MQVKLLNARKSLEIAGSTLNVVELIVYEVKPRDTINKISFNHSISVSLLRNLNQMIAGDNLIAGDILLIPIFEQVVSSPEG